MGKFLAVTGSLLVIATLGVGAWWVWPILFPPSPTGWLSTLAKADADLLQNRPDLARIALTPTPQALSVSGWLEWEKRVHAVANRTSTWEWASKVAATAQAQYPGNVDLAAYLVWTLLQGHHPDQALALAEKVLPGTPWDGLRTQAKIESLGLASGDWSDFRSTLGQPSEESFLVYQKLASLDPGPEVQKNALLTALSEGRLDEARDHLNVLTAEQRSEPPFDRLQGLMAYDSGDWARAATLLKALAQRQPDTLLVLADVYLHMGDGPQAQVIYDQMLVDHPDSIPLSLGVNRATLFLDQGEPAKALELIQRVAAQGAQNQIPEIRLLTLEAKFRLGSVEPVRTELDRIIETSEESTFGLNAELLKGRLFPDFNSIPRLWSLLHRHPDFSPVAERLVWSLTVTQDYSGAHKALDLHEATLMKQGLKSPWWVEVMRALLLAVEDKLPEASEAFSRVPSAWRDATFFANWSLTSRVLAQQVDQDQRKPLLDDALERINRAIDLLPPATEPAGLHRRSLWLTRRGELQMSLLPLSSPGDRGALRSGATEDFHQAVQLDPDNFRASFLLRQAMTAKEDTP